MKVLVTTVLEPLKNGVRTATGTIVGGIPGALTDTALPPVVASETTLTVPVKSPAAEGANKTLTLWLFEAGILPFHAPEKPKG